jgi:hypothetical protein
MDKDKKKIRNFKTMLVKMKLVLHIAVFCFVAIFTLSSFSSNAEACTCKFYCCCACPCSPTAFSQMASEVILQHNITRFLVFGTSGFLCERCGTARLGRHEDWLIDFLFLPNILPAMMAMTEELSAVMMQQMFIVGTFFDANLQLETQRLYQELTAEAHKDYHPSVGMCVFGTNVRSLANVDRRSDVMLAVLSERSLKRQLGNADVNAVDKSEDLEGRLAQFIGTYCDEDDNNKVRGNVIDNAGNATAASNMTGLRVVCNNGGNVDDRINKDIDYTRLVEIPLTLDVDFDDNPANPTADEEDIMALASYLYAHDIPKRYPSSSLSIFQNQDEYMDLRSVVAKRSVAETSFFAISAMKARGRPAAGGGGGSGSAEDTFTYMQSLLEQLGMDMSYVTDIYGENPSYLAQMEILAKNIYQRPEFYTELYDKPANVERKSVAMQAIDLMLERDLFKSQLRTESLISVLLEMEVMKKQEEVMNDIANLAPEGNPGAP